MYWTRNGKSAPFSAMIACSTFLPIGLNRCSRAPAITDNLADKARAMGIPLFATFAPMPPPGMTGFPADARPGPLRGGPVFCYHLRVRLIGWCAVSQAHIASSQRSALLVRANPPCYYH